MGDQDEETVRGVDIKTMSAPGVLILNPAPSFERGSNSILSIRCRSSQQPKTWLMEDRQSPRKMGA